MKAKAKKPGPPKEKIQVTIRLSKETMERLYAQIKYTGHRITDVFERALVLYLEEQGVELPMATMPVRFLEPNATTAEHRMILQFMIFLRMNQAKKLDAYHLHWRESYLRYLQLLTADSDRCAKTLALYTRANRNQA